MKKITLHLQHYHFEMFMRDKHKYFGELFNALKARNCHVSVYKIEPDTQYLVGLLEDYAILDKLLVGRANVASIRRAVYVPYWSVENSEYRTGFRLTNKTFDPKDVDPTETMVFVNKLRRKEIENPKPLTELGEAVYVPLQTRLDKKRQEQTMSPLDMLRAIRENEPNREIIVSKHPSNDYRDAELAELDEVLKDIDAELSTQSMEEIMPQARYIATMNSSVAFKGMVWGVPSMLFADADFHHVLTNVKDYENISDAFDAVRDHPRNFDTYIKWYLDDNMVSARKDDAIEKTIELLEGFGWDFNE